MVLAVGLALIVMDGTIVAVSLPTIIDDLHLDLTDAQWVNSLYSVVLAALLLTSGSLGDRIGRRRMFILGIVLFVAGSLWAATAGDAAALNSARVLQGVGGACILPSTLSTVNDMFRGKDRAAAFGVWGAVISGAAALGPLLGGWLTSTFTWEWIFLVNVPIGALLVVAALIAVPETTSPVKRRGYDVDGLLLSATGFGALVFAVIEGNTLGWWKPLSDLNVFGLTWSQEMPISIVPVLLAISLAVLVTFGFWERHRARVRRSALLDLNLFFTPTFSWGNVAAMMIAVGEFGLIFVLPLYLINAVGLSTMGAGYVLAAMAVGAFVSGALARHLAARLGAAGTVLVGVALEVIGVLVLAFTVHPRLVPGADQRCTDDLRRRSRIRVGAADQHRAAGYPGSGVRSGVGDTEHGTTGRSRIRCSGRRVGAVDRAGPQSRAGDRAGRAIRRGHSDVRGRSDRRTTHTR